MMNWPMHHAVERRAIRMHQMMDRLEVDVIAFVRLRRGETYAEARSICLSCLEGDKCLRWLDGKTDATPDFCPMLSAVASCIRAPAENESHVSESGVMGRAANAA